jgi:hypothetical protein
VEDEFGGENADCDLSVADGLKESGVGGRTKRASDSGVDREQRKRR